MNVCELHLEEHAGDASFAAARWTLFTFHEIRHVCRLGAGGEIAVLYDGEPMVDAWIAALHAKGFSASPSEDAKAAPLEAA